jgi:hypothetical protein
MQKKAFSFAVGALLFFAGAVSAATLTDNLNLRNSYTPCGCEIMAPELLKYRSHSARTFIFILINNLP